MSSSRIEQIIEEIEEYVESCRYQPLSSTKIIVNKEELEELLRELRLKTPDEIKRYQKIISNKDAILTDAQEKADNIIAEAKQQAQDLVSQTEIMKAAYAQATDTVNQANQEAQGILDSAQQDAANIRMGAMAYTDELLSNMSQIMAGTLADATQKFNEYIGTVQYYYDTVNSNRREIAPSLNQAPAMEQDYAPAEMDEELPVDMDDEELYDEGL